MINILLVDDQAMIRSGLRMILESDPEIIVAAEAENGAEGVRMAKSEEISWNTTSLYSG